MCIRDSLQLYHNGSHSFIDDAGTGNLKIRSGTLEVSNLASSKTSAVFNSSSGQELYYNDTKRFETTNTGSKVTGNLEVTGVLTYDDVTNVDSVGIITARQGIFIDDSITHIGDTNTKIRFPAVDTFTVETAGDERLRIADDGRIGINDSSPNDYELDIMKRPAATDAQIRLYNNGTGSSNDTIMRYQIGGTTSANYIYFGDSGDTNIGQIVYHLSLIHI